MYDSGLPEDTRQRLAEMAPSRLVVGIPSYRNSRTVGTLVQKVAAALDRHFADLDPVIVHADGHSFDDTLQVASTVPIPPTVRRLATRYQGLPGKGSALRVIFEITRDLGAVALLLIEADVTSFQPDWVPTLLGPVLSREQEMVLARYNRVEPLMSTADLILHPIMRALFRLPLHQPTSGEVAMAGGVAAYFADRDVWETDAARDGVDIWMAAETALEEGRLAEMVLPAKLHRSHESPTLAEAKFLQEVGTVFRLAQLHEEQWRHGPPPPPIRTIGRPAPPEPSWPLRLRPAEELWYQDPPDVPEVSRRQWSAIMTDEHRLAAEALVAGSPDGIGSSLWARIVYDFVTVYNQGEGDPDKVVSSLYPLYMCHHRTLLSAARATENPYAARAAAIQRQSDAFIAERPYFEARWNSYVTPEQLDLWRQLGLRP